MVRKSTTTADLEDKIANLEKRLTEISDTIETQTAQTLAESTQATQPPPPQEPPQMQTPPPQTTQYATIQKSRSEILAEYEQDYLQRLQKEVKEQAELQRAAEELVAKRKAQTQTKSSQTPSTKGSMPKGWTPS
ncbi:MAG: hypothetical protein ACE5GR_03905 [Nitrosopumilus sp.]